MLCLHYSCWLCLPDIIFSFVYTHPIPLSSLLDSYSGVQPHFTVVGRIFIHFCLVQVMVVMECTVYGRSFLNPISCFLIAHPQVIVVLNQYSVTWHYLCTTYVQPWISFFCQAPLCPACKLGLYKTQNYLSSWNGMRFWISFGFKVCLNRQAPKHLNAQVITFVPNKWRAILTFLSHYAIISTRGRNFQTRIRDPA